MVDVKFSMFFDRAGVIKKVKDGTKSVLSKAGAFVRRRAQTSIRKRKKSSTPGSPPSSHVGLLRQLIFFGYDARTESVVVGPKLLKSKSPTVPQLLEFGGRVRTKEGTPNTYRRFPFMAPALKAEAPKFPSLFANAVR